MDRRMERESGNDALFNALKLLDPEGILTPGSPEHEETEAMVAKWVDTYGTAKVLSTVMDCMKHVEGSADSK